MHRVLIFVLLICVFLTNGQYLQQYEGDRCVTEHGISGVCVKISECPAALENIQNKKPKICRSDVFDTVVCCSASVEPQRMAVATTMRSTETQATTVYVPKQYDYEEQEEEAKCPPIDPSSTAPKTGQKAWDKCVEYQEQYIYPCTRAETLSGDRVLKRSKNCKHTAVAMVINGEDAAEAEFPHMALLGFQPDYDDEIEFSCGGSVISDKFILTAGHCTHGGRLGPVAYALLGTLKRSDKYSADNLYKIKKIVKHPNYAPPAKYHDIALLETDRVIRLSSTVVPACLDVGDEPADTAIATGWGATAYIGANADVLQKVNLAKFSEWECYVWHKPVRNMERGFDMRTQLCYGDKAHSNDTCGGDSGGPLQVYSKRLSCMYVVVGLTSFGRECGRVGEPGVYTKVAQYVSWIESVVWP